MTAVAAGLFRPGKKDESLLTLIKKALVTHAESEVSTFDTHEAQDLCTALDGMSRIRKFFVLRAILQEARDQGISLKAIDWENIGDFLVKIAPIIKMIIEMFL
jgi:hypothetical protein